MLVVEQVLRRLQPLARLEKELVKLIYRHREKSIVGSVLVINVRRKSIEKHTWELMAQGVSIASKR